MNTTAAELPMGGSTSVRFYLLLAIVIGIGVFAVPQSRRKIFGIWVLFHQQANVRKLKGRNYAFVGSPGTGKSRLVNAIRGLEDSDNGAAVVRSWGSSELACFNLKPEGHVWDIPESERAKFFKKYPYPSFECIFVVVAGRIMESDIDIAQQALQHNVPVIFVHTKLDQDAASMKSGKSMSIKEAHRIARETIHRDTSKQLKENHLGQCRVLVVSSQGFLNASERFGDEDELMKELNCVLQLSVSV